MPIVNRPAGSLLTLLGVLLLVCGPCAWLRGDDAAGAPDGVDQPQPADDAVAGRAVIIQLHDEITPLSGALLRRHFEEALQRGVETIVIDIDSPGGFLSTSNDLVRMLSDAEVRTVALVRHQAISGAAMLAMASDQIVIAPHATIGDIGVIFMGADGAFRYAPEKARSVLAQQLRSLAEQHGRPPALAEAMVDKELVIYRVTRQADDQIRYMSNREWDALEQPEQWDRGPPVREAPGNTFFTATGRRAVELGVAEVLLEDQSELAAVLGLQAPIPLIQPSSIDTLIVILNSSYVTWLLLVVGLIALVIELGAPGVGVGGLVSILCFGLFFWSRFLGGTSGWLEVILFLVGVSFVLLEVLVIPGVGVAGVAGGLLTFTSLVMASRRMLLPENARDLTNLVNEIGVVLAAFVGFAIGLLVLSRFLGQLPLISRLALAPVVDEGGPPVPSLVAADGPSGDQFELQIGDHGRALGPLRPSGKMMLGEEICEVVSEGDFIPDGTPLQVIAVQGRRVVVRRAS